MGGSSVSPMSTVDGVVQPPKQLGQVFCCFQVERAHGWLSPLLLYFSTPERPPTCHIFVHRLPDRSFYVGFASKLAWHMGLSTPSHPALHAFTSSSPRHFPQTSLLTYPAASKTSPSHLSTSYTASLSSFLFPTPPSSSSCFEARFLPRTCLAR